MESILELIRESSVDQYEYNNDFTEEDKEKESDKISITSVHYLIQKGANI